MAVTITGNADSGTISNGTPGAGTNVTTVGGIVLLRTAGTFTSGVFDVPRIAGLWNSAGTTYKGLAWVRNYQDANEIVLMTPFMDKDGDDVTPINGDTWQVSTNWADEATTGIAWNSAIREVTLTDDIISGTAGDVDSVCFYDEGVQINRNTAATAHSFEFRGGLFVHGRLIDYTARTFENPVSFHMSGDSGGSGGGTGDQLIVTDNDAMVWWIGGSLIFDTTPSRIPGGFIGNGVAAALWQKWWGISTNSDMVSPDGGANWDSNPTDQEFADIKANPNSTNAIALRLADGTVKGGTLRGEAGTNFISMYGSDAVGTFAIGSTPGDRAKIIDLGGDANTTFWRANTNIAQTINATNSVTPNREAGTGVDPGANIQTNATMNFFFADIFSNVVSGTNFRVEEDGDDSLEDSGTDVSGDVVVTIREAQVTSGDSEAVDDTAWNWAFGNYDYQLVFGQFVTVTVATGGGATAKDVPFNTFLNQLDDLNVTATKVVVDAYTTIDDLSELYDRAKSHKVDNLEVPSLQVDIITGSGSNLDMGVLDLIIDTSAASVWNYNTTPTPDAITIKPTSSLSTSAKFNKLITTGSVTLENLANLGTGITIEGDVYLNAATDLTGITIDGDLRIDTGADSTLTFSGVTVTGDVWNDATANTLTINLTGGSSVTAGDPGTLDGETNAVSTVPIKVTVKDAATLGLIQNARVYITAAAGGPATEGDVIVNELTDISGEVNETIQYDGDQPVAGVVRKGTP